jgi:hypothetical protein
MLGTMKIGLGKNKLNVLSLELIVTLVKILDRFVVENLLSYISYFLFQNRGICRDINVENQRPIKNEGPKYKT